MGYTPRNVGASLKVGTGPVPKAESAGTVNGAGIDRMSVTGRQGYMSCVLHAQCGAATGSPSAQTYDVKLQDAVSDGATYADYTDDAGNGALTQITADNTVGRENVDLSGAKRFIRIVRTVGFTGGTTPTLPCAETITFQTLEDPQT